MARKISADKPIVSGTSPQIITKYPQGKPGQAQIVPRVMGGPDVTLLSRNPKITVTARLRRPVQPAVPRPKVSVADRPGRVGLTRWDGRDPHEIVIPLIFDRLPTGRSVEAEIEQLELLALRHKDDTAPPVVRTTGPVPTPTGVKDPQWRVAGFQPAEGDKGYFTEYNSDGKRIRYPVDVLLTERVVDTTLASSIDRTASSVGITNDKTKVRDGETTLHKVAKRVYGDRSKAKDIAVANGFVNLGIRLKPGTTLRLP